MKIINFTKSNYWNWRKKCIEQSLGLNHLSPTEHKEWFEKEWKCKIIYEYDNSTRVSIFEFTDEDYLIAVLRFGSPE